MEDSEESSKRRRIDVNRFGGNIIPSISTLQFEEISSPFSFFHDYISKRIPVKIIGHINDNIWQGENWTNDYLRNNCGECTVKIEYKGDEGRFGRGNEITLPFRDFLDDIEQGTYKYYLTTQELNYTFDGQPDILSNPLNNLIGQFPWSPKLMGNLIVNNINLWFGSSPQPVTSGLHHDFHDNLYIVLRGLKSILLFSPYETENMYTIGELLCVHENGRINYVSQPTRADGADVNADVAQTAVDLLEMASAKLDHIQKSLQKSNHSNDSDNNAIEIELLEAEEEIEDALEALLDVEANNNNNSNDNNDNSDDEESNEEYEDRSTGSDDDGSNSTLLDRVRESLFPNNIINCGNTSTPITNIDGNTKKDSISSNLTATKKDPLNFSRVDLTLTPDKIKEKYPLFYEAQKRGAGIRVDVHAGEMLYIPAGWFHEVQSSGEAPNGHMAFNYWYHPPDNSDFEHPYKSDFWSKDWKARNLETKYNSSASTLNTNDNNIKS